MLFAINGALEALKKQADTKQLLSNRVFARLAYLIINKYNA
jgi:hypothetical protein